MAFINGYLKNRCKSIINDLNYYLPCRYECISLKLDLKIFYSSERHQYHSTLILSHLLKHLPDDGMRIVGITDVDIYIPILTYLFGEAQLHGQGALVSTHRLDTRFYGLPENKPLLYQRIVKEILHELGHTFGLVHCVDYRCVMHSSTYVEDIDLKSSRFCKDCWEKLQNWEPQ